MLQADGRVESLAALGGLVGWLLVATQRVQEV